eukprot:scaffold25871_cov79-Isochrysis_galbana.AAC.3
MPAPMLSPPACGGLKTSASRRSGERTNACAIVWPMERNNASCGGTASAWAAGREDPPHDPPPVSPSGVGAAARVAQSSSRASSITLAAQGRKAPSEA